MATIKRNPYPPTKVLSLLDRLLSNEIKICLQRPKKGSTAVLVTIEPQDDLGWTVSHYGAGVTPSQAVGAALNGALKEFLEDEAIRGGNVFG